MRPRRRCAAPKGGAPAPWPCGAHERHRTASRRARAGCHDRRRLGRIRRARISATAFAPVRKPPHISRWRVCCALADGYRVPVARRAAPIVGDAAGFARSSVPCEARSAFGILPAVDRRRFIRCVAFFGGLFPRERRHAAGAHLFSIPRLSRCDGERRCRRRRLCLHGGMGSDGACVVLSRDD